MSDNINAIFEDKEFELKSPVHALNFNDNAYVIAGMHLMSLEKEERDKYLKVPEDVTDSSILFFDDRHLFEIGGMLIGIINSTINVIHCDDSLEESMQRVDITNILRNAKYNTYINIKHNIINSILCIKGLSYDKYTEFMNVLFEVLEKIWFISYADIDKLIRLAVDEFNKEIKNGEEAEPADTAD